MKSRRTFIALLGGAAAAWPVVARGQQPGRLPIIGFMGSTTAAAGGPLIAAFTARLRELGWVESRNVGIEYRWAEGRSERYAEIVAEFIITLSPGETGKTGGVRHLRCGRLTPGASRE